jgi:tight adherence protein B
VSTGGASASAVLPSGIAIGSAVHPHAVTKPQAPGPLKGKAGLFLIGMLVLAGAGLLVYAVVLLVTREESGLSYALRTYDGGVAPTDDDEVGQSLVQTALIQRAVETTARLAEERGLLEKVESKLEQADLKLRAAEALFFYGAGSIILVVLLGVIGGPVLALVGLVLALLLPPAILNFLAGQRLRKFTSLLPDTLQLLASSLRAGFSFMQGVEAVSQEVDDPMGAELRRVIVEARLGKPVEAALEDCARRMKSPDFDWAVMAVGIQREVGGNLADLLDTVSKTMIERERLRRDVRALTAEGRMSAIVLGILPPGVGLMFYVMNPSYMKVLFHHTGGLIALGVAAIGMVGGFLWMQKIVNIDI